MSTITVWLLILASNSGSSGKAIAISQDKFLSAAECQATASQIERITAAKSGMMYIYTACVEAKVKP